MFECSVCKKRFSRPDSLKRHSKICPTDKSSIDSALCQFCGNRFSRRDSLLRHIRNVHPQPDVEGGSPMKKRLIDAASTSGASTSRAANPAPIKHCDLCNETYTGSRFGHLKSLRHKEKCVLPNNDSVKLLKSSYKSRIATYKILNTSPDNLNVMDFFHSNNATLCNLIQTALSAHTAAKINLELFASYILPTKEKREVKSFNSKNVIFTMATNINDELQQFYAILKAKMEKFAMKDSGWALEEILHLEVNINKYTPLRGSTYIDLPDDIKQKHAVLNIHNFDQECFKWCILAHLHPASYIPQRINNYQQYSDELNFQGINFPVALKDISKFEMLNPTISVNVYGIEQRYDNEKDRWFSHIIGPFYLTSNTREVHVNLLLITDDETEKSHYCLIKNLSRLISSQISKHKTAKFLCNGCLQYFSSEEKLEAHTQFDCNHTVTKLPTTDLVKDKFGNDVPANILKFQNFERSMKVPFVIYADFECILKPIHTCQPSDTASFTYQTHLHVPYSFAYNIVCSYDNSLSIFRSYRGEDAAVKFNEILEKDALRIYEKHLSVIKPLNMSEADEAEFESATHCHLCNKPFTDNETNGKVRNHCHLTGDFLGAAHSICNLNYKVPLFIPVFFHNLSGYDAHLFISHLASKFSDISVIAQNKEKYISFSKKFFVGQVHDPITGKMKNLYLKLRFVDSFRFMASSLDTLSQNLSSDECHFVRKYFPDDVKFNLIRQKGVFPYSYLDSFDKLNDATLPAYSQFYDNIRRENISENDYERALEVWNLFECKTLGDYSDVYLKSDVLLLSDVFEAFRNICIESYKLDAAHYYTAPGFSWDAMLKSTNIELELLTDIEMVHFVKQGIRGGICQCSQRLATANNKFMPGYDPSQPTSFITYLDATNLYGHSMSQYLPYKGFEWETSVEWNKDLIMGLSDEAEEGYFFEVDLEYPSELHDSHKDLPFCPENIVPPGAKIKKLCLTLYDKTKYVIHYRNLKQVLAHGLKLKRVHKVLKFKQSAWLKSYMDLNTRLRNAARNPFEKGFFKLLNCSIFGKTMESVDKRVDVKLVTSWDNVGKKPGAKVFISRPHFKNCSIFTEDFVAIQMNKSFILYNKPIYIGFAVLDLSKLTMYEFYYDYIRAKYGDARLLYTDTDSLILQLFCDNFYQDIKDNLDRFDTSNYSEDNMHQIPKNESIIGKMKDEYKGRIIWEFSGTGAKAYSVNVEGECVKKAKGVKYDVVRKDLTQDEYKVAASIPDTKIYKKMTLFRSTLHKIYTENKNKVALSFHDDKRYIMPNNYQTLPWGHKDIPQIDDDDEAGCTSN